MSLGVKGGLFAGGGIGLEDGGVGIECFGGVIGDEAGAEGVVVGQEVGSVELRTIGEEAVVYLACDVPGRSDR